MAGVKLLCMQTSLGGLWVQKLVSKNEEGDGKVTVPPGFNSF